MICKDCGKPFLAAGKNVVVCPACVNVRLGNAAKPAPKRRKAKPAEPKASAPAPAPVVETPAPEVTAAPAPDEAALTALRAELKQARADLMDANAEATRLWREKRELEERLRKAHMSLKMLKAEAVQ